MEKKKEERKKRENEKWKECVRPDSYIRVGEKRAFYEGEVGKM
jgi:hypothetical protein